MPELLLRTLFGLRLRHSIPGPNAPDQLILFASDRSQVIIDEFPPSARVQSR